ncbi:MAG: hypothetical protein ABI670_11795 [Chloroflexota bacterium]
MIQEMGLGDASPGEIASKVTKETFKEHGLYSLLQHKLSGSPYRALRVVFPGLREWEMKHVPQGFWQGESGREHGRDATRWLIEKVGLSGATPQEIARDINFFTFAENGLRGMLDRVYGGSPHAALVDLYPEIEGWDHKTSPRDWWQGEEGRERARSATRSMLRYMGLDSAPAEVLAKKISQASFKQYELLGMLSVVYSSSPYEALRDVLGDSMHPWLMQNTPSGYWSGDKGRIHALMAMRWLTEQLGITENAGREELEQRMTRKEFESRGLSGMLQTVYRSRIADAINDLLSEGESA